MSSAGTDFRQLHQLHQELKKVQDQLVKGPRQIKFRQKRVEEMRGELASQEEELKLSRAEADRKNLDLKSKETNIVDLKRKLNAAKTNREYEIISGQIEADNAAKAVLEDEIIEFLDRVDELQKQIEEAKQQISDAEEDVRNYANEFESKAAGLQTSENELLAKIKEAEVIIPTEIREQYRRLVEAYGPDAMADCTNGVCANCHVQMTPQAKVLVNSGKLQFCGSCRRLQYSSN